MTATGTEIERKFLVDAPPADLPAGEAIDQGYLAITDDGLELRVRRRAGRCTLTIKQGAGTVRAEEDLEIEPERFERLWPLSAGRRVEKTRHVVPWEGGLELEVDVYTGDLAGLVVAEVEFASEADAAAFDAPPWFGTDVTADGRYKNQSLALHGRPDAE